MGRDLEPMTDPMLKYEELKKHELPWMKALDGEKHPIARKVLILFLFPVWLLFYPLIAWKAEYLLWAWKIKKLIKGKKYKEGFDYCVDKLTNWQEDDPNPKKKREWPPFQAAWWGGFSSLCECAVQQEIPDTMKKIYSVFEKRPDGNAGYAVSNGYCDLTRTAWLKGSKEQAWSYVEKAVESDPTYGFPYYLRAWLGEQLGLGRPFDDLVSAIRNQDNLKEPIFKDEFFKTKTGLLENLKKV